MTNAVVTINGAQPALPTLLGQGTVRIPAGGKIRAGIKVLSKKAAEHPRAKEIYERGVAANHSFEAIERAISEAVPELKTPLIPKNVPWFTVRPDDFPNPEIAKEILAAYGEDRGDGTKRLYRFPVVFPADMWQAVMPHELIAWGANEKKFWSEYAPDGRVRYCKCYAPVPMDPTRKRAIRIFGGRKTTLRQENGGLCDPELCREYQNRQCNLSGRFIFFIPGIKSIGAFELHTNSFYAMNAAIQKFETIAFMRGGRISGFLDAKRTSFFITKKLKEVPHIDETGHAVRVAHWIIELEAPIDVTALLRANEEDETAIVNGNQAAQMLEGTGLADETAGDEPLIGAVASKGPAPEDGAEMELPGASVQGNEPHSAAARAQSAPAGEAGLAKSEGGNGPSVAQVINAAADFGIDGARYATYAAKRWGPGWKINADGRRRAFAEIERFRDDPDGLTDKIDAEIDGFA
jgi:Recombination directionality factor-like